MAPQGRGSKASRPLLTLQSALGNRAVVQLLAPHVTVSRTSAAMGASGQAWQRLGSRGPEVSAIQESLNRIGTEGTPLVVTGHFDAATDRVVRRFQRDTGIGVDGIVGPHTWEALDRHTAGPAEVVSQGEDFHAGVGRPTDEQIAEIGQTLNPTSADETGARDWDGRHDPAARNALRVKLLAALQKHLEAVKLSMLAREQAKREGRVLSLSEREGTGRAAKRYVDAMFGDIASAAMLTRSQEADRAQFNFQAGTNLLDASDPAVNPPDPRYTAQIIADIDDDAQDAQGHHGFNRHRTSQGEPAFFEQTIGQFLVTGTNRADLERYYQFGFAWGATEGSTVLTQVFVIGDEEFSEDRDDPGVPSPAERRERWYSWEYLTHEYFHLLGHPNFFAASNGNMHLEEGFAELFSRAVLVDGGAIKTAQDDADPALRHEVEGGDYGASFEPRFVPEYDPGSYETFLESADAIVDQVGMDAVRSAYFLGHVHNIGLKPDGTMIDPNAPDASRHLAPERVVIPRAITSVTGVSILTGAPEADIVAANTGLVAGGALPGGAHTDGLVVPGTSHHRTLAVRSRTERAVETKAKIAEQHGTTVDAIVRANPNLNHREPREGEWVLIPVH